ncbi:MAG: energy transducer TonB [Flavobacterium sp.]|nr:energy transducer TonB [Flavobacterium sp.]
MRKIFFVIISCFIFHVAAAQETYFTTENGINTYTKVEYRPEFPGGMQKFYQYVGSNYKYPKVKVSGKVIVQFVIDEEGRLTDIKVLRDLGYGTGEEAVRVLSKCPKWIPGTQDGKPVRVLYALPISVNN